MNIYTFDSKKQKKVLCGNFTQNTFIREVLRGKHYMNVVGGYGIQEDAFNELLDLGCKYIVIKELDTKSNLYSQIKTWQDRPKVHIANYGSGIQRFLGEKYMVKK